MQIKTWEIVNKGNGRLYIHNEDFTKEGYVTYKNIAGVITLSEEASALPKYVREFLKKELVK